MFDKEQLSLSWQDYKRIFYIAAIMTTAPIAIVVGFLSAWGYDSFSFTILQPLAWILGCAVLCSPIIWVLQLIVTRQLQKMIQQLEAESQQSEK